MFRRGVLDLLGRGADLVVAGVEPHGEGQAGAELRAGVLALDTEGHERIEADVREPGHHQPDEGQDQEHVQGDRSGAGDRDAAIVEVGQDQDEAGGEGPLRERARAPEQVAHRAGEEHGIERVVEEGHQEVPDALLVAPERPEVFARPSVVAAGHGPPRAELGGGEGRGHAPDPGGDEQQQHEEARPHLGQEVLGTVGAAASGRVHEPQQGQQRGARGHLARRACGFAHSGPRLTGPRPGPSRREPHSRPRRSAVG